MCGICGMFNVGIGSPVSVQLLKKMADTLHHRGPDDEGFFLDGKVGLAHRRLSIIDLEGGHQPLTNEDQSVWVVFNGEIYNFQELRDELLEKGHTFKTQSDTEVIVHLYEERGEACFSLLRGMFAIVIWDKRNQTLLLARDRVGKKPLFYNYDGKRVIFGSEMKAILEVPGVPRDLDFEALSDYFSLLYIPAPKSIFRSIRKVLPGHYLVISDKGLRDVEYWDLTFAPIIRKDIEEWYELILDKFREAVKIRLMSEVPLGAFLSGGVDSSAVVALMHECSQDSIMTSSIGFIEEEFNELEFARMVATKFQTNHHEEIVRPDAVGIVEKLVWHYDEPFADSSAVPTYYVSQVAKQNVTVALSGDGGDENLAGYRRYYFDRRENFLRGIMPSSLRKPVFGMLAQLYPKADWAPRILRGKATMENLARSPLEAYFRSVSAFWPEWKAQVLHVDLKRQLAGYDTLDLFRHYYNKVETDDLLSRIQYLDIKTYLPDDILAKVDRASMANSLEVRAPMLDHQFMELLSTIPSSLKLKGIKGKYILKKAFEGRLPSDVLWRPKMGFGVPLAQWFRNDLKDMAYSVIFNEQSNDVLNQSTVQHLWQEHQSGRRNRSTELWALFMFRLWQKKFT